MSIAIQLCNVYGAAPDTIAIIVFNEILHFECFII